MDWKLIIGSTVLAAIVSAIVSILTTKQKVVADIDIAVRKLSADQAEANRQREEANKRPFLEKQLEICLSASEVASRLATEIGADEWKAARTEFLRLFWGQLAIVEDRNVEKQMKDIYYHVKDISIPAGLTKDLYSSLEKLSANLSYEIRRLILKSWDINLESLESHEEMAKLLDVQQV